MYIFTSYQEKYEKSYLEKKILSEKTDILSNPTLFLIVENLQNTNIKTKKIKLIHNPFTQKIPVSIWYKNPSNIFPQYMQ